MSSLTQAAPVDLALVRRLERSALLAVPAEQEWEVGGWLCRWGADGRVGRVASACVSPFGPARADLAPVAEVAAAYAALRLPALLRLTPLAPPELVAATSPPPGRSPVAVMARDLGATAPGRGDPEGSAAARPPRPVAAPRPATAAAGFEVTLDADPTDAWQDAFLATHEDAGTRRLALAAAAPRPRRFAAARLGGEVAGLALGVVAEGALGVFDVMTAPRHRRRGVATAVVGALLAWGREAGADVAYLQVAATNLPAAALYARLGFGTAYTYAYSEVGRSPR